MDELRDAIDTAKLERRLSIKIDAGLWDRVMPLARDQCGVFFQFMERPWRAFMFGGVWIERG